MNKAAPAKKDALAAQQSGALAEVPEYLSQLASSGAIGSGEGFEEVRASDLKVPRIKIAQKGTPEAEADSDEYIEGLKLGEFFHSITGELYGPELLFVPLLKFSNQALFKNMNDGGGILCRSHQERVKNKDNTFRIIDMGVGDPGGECGKCKWKQFDTAKEFGRNGKAPACTEFFNFPALVYANKILSSEVAIFSLKSTSIDTAKHLIDLASSRRLTIKSNGQSKQIKAPMWSGVYKATTKRVVDGKMSWYEVVIDNAGWVSTADATTAKMAFDFMHAMREEGRLNAVPEQERSES